MIRVTTAITGGSGGNQWATHYFGGTTAGQATVAAQATTNFWEELSSAIHNSYTFNVEDDQDLVDPTTGDIIGVFSNAQAAVTGDSAAEPLPWATQGLIRWRTGEYEGGREVRGRTFVPGFTEAAQALGVPAAATITKLNDAASVLTSNGAGGGQLQVYSPTHGLMRQVDSFSAWDKWALLRSRRD